MASLQDTSTHFSNSSFLSLSSVKTLLPEYSSDAVGESSSSTSNKHPISNATSSNRLSTHSLLSLSSVDTLLPQYSVPDTPLSQTTTLFRAHELLYSYPIRQRNPWATLHLHTRDTVPGDPKSLPYRPRLPRFWSCDPVRGNVELELDRPQNIHQISITLKGTIVLSSHTEGSFSFLNREFTVWDKSMGDPPQSNNTDSNSTQKKKDTRLASGRFTFPFTFPFPTHPDTVLTDTFEKGHQSTGQPQRNLARHFISAHDESPSSSESSHTSGHPHTFSGSDPRSSIPQTFKEKDIDPHVAYDVSVRIVHGIFKTSSKIKTEIAYFPASEPLPQLQKRRRAYEAGALIPCPMDDPEGWFTLPKVTINGVVKTGDGNLPLHTKVDCTLYVAQPLSYTRGSIIPCFITIHSDGVEVSNLLQSTGIPTVRLLRRLWHPTMGEGGQTGPNMRDCTSFTGWTYAMAISSDMNLVTHEVGRANWWIPSKEVVQGANVRHFEGEIHLKPDLQTSCDFQHFRIEYAVELLSFQTANFTPDVHPSSMGRKRDIVVASNPVEIMSLYRQDEPVPTAFSEPPETYLKLRVSSQMAKVGEST